MSSSFLKIKNFITYSQFFGIVMTLGMRAMMNQVSILAANLFVSCVLLVGTVMTGTVHTLCLSVCLLVCLCLLCSVGGNSHDRYCTHSVSVFLYCLSLLCVSLSVFLSCQVLCTLSVCLYRLIVCLCLSLSSLFCWHFPHSVYTLCLIFCFVCLSAFPLFICFCV